MIDQLRVVCVTTHSYYYYLVVRDALDSTFYLLRSEQNPFNLENAEWEIARILTPAPDGNDLGPVDVSCALSTPSMAAQPPPSATTTSTNFVHLLYVVNGHNSTTTVRIAHWDNSTNTFWPYRVLATGGLKDEMFFYSTPSTLRMVHLTNPFGSSGPTRARLVAYPVTSTRSLDTLTPVVNVESTLEHCLLREKISKMGVRDGLNFHFWCRSGPDTPGHTIYTINNNTTTIQKTAHIPNLPSNIEFEVHALSPVILPDPKGRADHVFEVKSGMLIDNVGLPYQFDLDLSMTTDPNKAVWNGGGLEPGELRVAELRGADINDSASKSRPGIVVAIISGSMAAMVAMIIAFRHRFRKTPWFEDLSGRGRGRGGDGGRSGGRRVGANAVGGEGEYDAQGLRRLASITSIENPPPPYSERSDTPPPPIDDEDAPPPPPLDEEEERFKRPSDQELTATYNQMKNELQSLAQKIGELETEADEHTLVLETLNPLAGDRKCFRLVGGVLVERTVKEVLPALKTNQEGIRNVTMQLVQKYKTKEDEFMAFQKKYNIQVKQ
ncbi:hypothetical protein DFQ26_004264 [Actinomortierella ambigua]|nr:hypothetical protein DFQ26_004264 [Actinomortierella ambigua]